MNPSNKTLALVALCIGCLALAAVCQAAPMQLDTDESLADQLGGAGEEQANQEGGDFEEGPASRASQATNEDQDEGPAASSGSFADSQEEPRGLDSNIANAKVQMSPTDMAAAAGHHYHGHGVSGKMEMGAHTEKKGAFGWHAKFPVGGKGHK